MFVNQFFSHDWDDTMSTPLEINFIILYLSLTLPSKGIWFDIKHSVQLFQEKKLQTTNRSPDNLLFFVLLLSLTVVNHLLLLLFPTDCVWQSSAHLFLQARWTSLVWECLFLQTNKQLELEIGGTIWSPHGKWKIGFNHEYLNIYRLHIGIKSDLLQWFLANWITVITSFTTSTNQTQRTVIILELQLYKIPWSSVTSTAVVLDVLLCHYSLILDKKLQIIILKLF